MFILQSSIDGQSFEVDQKIINASNLLKNVCAITEVNEPIAVSCSSIALSLFIDLINHYDILADKHDTLFEMELLGEFDDQSLVQLVNELCTLDSDFFLDSVADIILDRIKTMLWTDIQNYFQLDRDFSDEERNTLICNMDKYWLSVDCGVLAFPFPNTDFAHLKNGFYTPMNVLLARIVKRSNNKTAFHLSLVNKTLKNESDRHPLKVKEFKCFERWSLILPYGQEVLNYEGSLRNRIFFDLLAKRKVIVDNDVTLIYNSRNATYPDVLRASSMDFVFPSTTDLVLNVKFCFNKNEIYDFDIFRCHFSLISYSLSSINMKFAEFYNQLVAKDLSKEIRLHCRNVFQVFHDEHVIHDVDMFHNTTITYDEAFEMFKKPNAPRFYKMIVPNSILQNIPKFKKFIMESGSLMDYMEKDGIISAAGKLFDIPQSYDRTTKIYNYTVSDVIEFLNRDPDEVYCKCKTGCKANSRCKCRKMERMCNSRCHIAGAVECCNV